MLTRGGRERGMDEAFYKLERLSVAVVRRAHAGRTGLHARR
jgi:hypothetical protein